MVNGNNCIWDMKKNTIVLYLIENDNNFTNNPFIIKHEKKHSLIQIITQNIYKS